MGKGALKYGGKSGILPVVRPVFKKNPIRPKTPYEIEEQAKLEQGFAEGIPLPKKKGFTFERYPSDKPIITIEERISKVIEPVNTFERDFDKLTQDQIWQTKRNEIRKNFLKEAYISEAERLAKLEKLKMKNIEAQRAKEQVHHYEESEATRLTLPSIQNYLDGPIMRPRTEEEKEIMKEQRIYNRKSLELKQQEEKANDLLDLYHAAANFITTEEELEQAIIDAFEVNFNKFDTAQSSIESKLNPLASQFANIDINEQLITDTALGELNGKPGLQVVQDTLNGELEKLRREAQLKANQNS